MEPFKPKNTFFSGYLPGEIKTTQASIVKAKMLKRMSPRRINQEVQRRKQQAVRRKEMLRQ